MSSMEVKTKKFDEIKPYQRNPQKHEGRSVEALKDSIRLVGFRVPILIDNDNEIVAGHGRYKACRQLEGNLDDRIQELREKGQGDSADSLETINNGEIPFLPVEDLTEKQVKKFRMADNRVQELSEVDEDNRKFELREVEGAPGYNEEDLNDIFDNDPDFTDLDEGDVEEKAEELDEHYEDLTEAKQESQVDVPCPHCGGSIKIDKNEFKRRHLDEDEY